MLRSIRNVITRKTRFTSYSMTSSIMRRSEKLVSLDDQFEEMFLDKYDEDEVGDLTHKNLEDNEIELDSELLKNMMQKDYDTFVPQVMISSNLILLTEISLARQCYGYYQRG